MQSNENNEAQRIGSSHVLADFQPPPDRPGRRGPSLLWRAVVGFGVLTWVGASGTGQAEAGVELAFSCLEQDGPEEKMSGTYNSGTIKPSVSANKKFDAREAEFEFPETESHAMLALGGGKGASNMCWAGGFFTSSTIWHALDISWWESKHGYDNTSSSRGKMENTTSAHSRESGTVWSGIHVYNMHDGIRTTQSNDWTIQYSWFDYIRDDCIENDGIKSGTIRDSLFDGCYSGLSLRPGRKSSVSANGRVITMDKVLMRMEPMPYPSDWSQFSDRWIYLDAYEDVPFGNGNTFKLAGSNVPDFVIKDSVFLYEHDFGKTLFPPSDSIKTCENNTIIWLGDPEKAPDYLLKDFPDCFTLITDETEGLSFWRDRAADWHQRHPGVGAGRKPLLPGEFSWPRFGASPIFRTVSTTETTSGTEEPTTTTEETSGTTEESTTTSETTSGTSEGTTTIVEDSADTGEEQDTTEKRWKSPGKQKGWISGESVPPGQVKKIR